jgi:hypothetical protein
MNPHPVAGENHPDATKDHENRGPSKEFLYKMVAGAGFEPATFGL